MTHTPWTCDSCRHRVTNAEELEYFKEWDAWYCYLCAPDPGDPDSVPVQRSKNWTQGK